MGTEALLPFEEARARILADVKRMARERVALRDAAGRVLAEDLVAAEPLPRFDYSAMDGYAVAAADFAGDGPWTLPLRGESAAGGEPAPFERGGVFRILSGAPVPRGADAVVMQENVAVARREKSIVFSSKPTAGQHIRRAGEDLRAGARALAAGVRLGPGQLALAGMLDRAELTVASRPVVAIACTGDELRAPGSRGGAASIPESNSAPLAALAAQAGAQVRVLPIVRDDPEATAAAITEGLLGVDLLLTVGGVSVGDHDHVRPALERANVALDFWRVAIKPGKPLAVGRGDRAHVLGLPGNPASAMVTFAVFGLPLLRAMQGDSRPIPTPLRAKLAAPAKRTADRLELARATLDFAAGELVARLHSNQASGAATSLAESDGLAMIPQGDEPLEARALVEVLRWADF
jgi:molybdopterin molybdotransferase